MRYVVMTRRKFGSSVGAVCGPDSVHARSITPCAVADGPETSRCRIVSVSVFPVVASVVYTSTSTRAASAKDWRKSIP